MHGTVESLPLGLQAWILPVPFIVSTSIASLDKPNKSERASIIHMAPAKRVSMTQHAKRVEVYSTAMMSKRWILLQTSVVLGSADGRVSHSPAHPTAPRQVKAFNPCAHVNHHSLHVNATLYQYNQQRSHKQNKIMENNYSNESMHWWALQSIHSVM